MTDEGSDGVKHGRHEWAFAAVPPATGMQLPTAIAICVRCGIVRSAAVDRSSGGQFDLSGGCPGYPDREQTKRPRPRSIIGG
jgi:hypothetical protein